MDDARFDYSVVPNWRKGGKQTVKSTFVTELDDNNVFDPYTNQLEWVIDTKNPVLFDSLTRFHVDIGVFVSTKGVGTPARDAVAAGVGVVGVAAVAAVPGEWGEYTACPANEWRNFRPAPNFFEKKFKGYDIYHFNDQPKIHNESNFIPFELNTLLYWMMDEKLKNEICQEPWHPARAVPNNDGKWNFDENGAWHNYSKHLLTGGARSFLFTPLHWWPMFQGTNHYAQKGFRPRALPVNVCGKLSLKIRLVDRPDNDIYILPAARANKRYQIRITKFKLCVEEAVLNASNSESSLRAATVRNAVVSSGKIYNWPGVCRQMRNEAIPANSFIHTIRFDEAVYPEIILIFALSKNVTGGSYKYSSHVPGEPHFIQHNIEQVNLKYGSFNTSMNYPDFGTVGDVNAELNVVRNYKRLGVFGMKVNSKIVTPQSAVNGFRNTDFPHVALHLVQTDGLEEGQPRARTVPLLTNSTVLTGKPKELILNLKFRNPLGSPADASFIVYLGYTDTNMIFKDKKFFSPYGLF
jgi:hypothetical protein